MLFGLHLSLRLDFLLSCVVVMIRMVILISQDLLRKHLPVLVISIEHSTSHTHRIEDPRCVRRSLLSHHLIILVHVLLGSVFESMKVLLLLSLFLLLLLVVVVVVLFLLLFWCFST